MKQFLSISFLKSQSGAAAAEMALLVPLLITLMFGSFELGYYFYNEHVVVKAVRDAARFAGRQPSLFLPEPCVPGVISTSPAPTIDKVARFGKATVTVSDKPKVYGWTSPVEIEILCPGIGSYQGIYKGKANVPVVRVTARNVQYPSLFQTLGFTSTGLTLNASSESAVMGI